jgi:hypothetical protein
MGLLFETTPENVLIHLKNIFAENELPEAATAAFSEERAA